MKKFIRFFALLIILIVVWQGFYFYSSINKPLRTGQNEARSFVEENTDINIKEMSFYHGTEAYYVFKGTNNEKEKVIIWVPHTLDDIVIKRQDEGLSFDDVKKFVTTELNPEKIISIKLGVEDSFPVYEIIYKDQQGRYSYYFINFTDGTYLKHYHLKV